MKEETISKGLIEQTAIDYDMEVSEVERIAKFYPNDFYEKLEEYIMDRSRKLN
jgi:DNA-binding NtrC family response regulator